MRAIIYILVAIRGLITMQLMIVMLIFLLIKLILLHMLKYFG